MEYYECLRCGNIISDKGWEVIIWKGRKYFVCPECLEELLADRNIREMDEKEVREIEAEWKADETYDERRCV